MKYISYPFSRYEDLHGNYVVATYLVFGITVNNALDKIGGFAVGQTVGTWIKVPGVTDEMVDKYQARVLSINNLSSEEKDIFLVNIAFPSENFGGSFAQLLTSLLGNDVSTSLQLKLVDLVFLNASAQDLGYVKKPVSAIDKLRKMTHVNGRPLILNMIKPCLGFTPEVGANFFYEVAKGGVDLIKDDELLASPVYNDVIARMRAYKQAALRAKHVTNKETIYLPNITNTPKKMRETAKAAIDEGIQACLINFVSTGLDAFSEICHEFSKQLFIMGHYAGIGTMNGIASGVSNSVYLGVLPRIAGADAVMTMFPKQRDEAGLLDYYKNVQAQQLPMNNIDSVVTTVGGGVTPLDLPNIVNDLGKDVIIGIGGAIQGHPQGPTAGAKAAMMAAESIRLGMTMSEAATRCPELAISINLWGNKDNVA